MVTRVKRCYVTMVTDVERCYVTMVTDVERCHVVMVTLTHVKNPHFQYLYYTVTGLGSECMSVFIEREVKWATNCTTLYKQHGYLYSLLVLLYL